MSIFTTIARYTSDYRARRRRYYNHLKLSSLPLEIQKDIGWTEAFVDGEEGRRTRGAR
jgi:hypothetical protein